MSLIQYILFSRVKNVERGLFVAGGRLLKEIDRHIYTVVCVYSVR